VEKALKILKNEPELREFQINSIELQDHALAKMIRFTITRAPIDEYEHIIPILIE